MSEPPVRTPDGGTSDPRPVGRAAAAIGAVAVVSGAAAVLGDALIVVLLVCAGTLAVRSAESLVDRRRVLAGLVAAGAPVAVLREDSLRKEAEMAALPLSLVGVLLGAVGTGSVIAASGDSRLTSEALGLVLVQMVVTVALTSVAIRVITPRLLLATALDNPRTE